MPEAPNGTSGPVTDKDTIISVGEEEIAARNKAKASFESEFAKLQDERDHLLGERYGWGEREDYPEDLPAETLSRLKAIEERMDIIVLAIQKIVNPKLEIPLKQTPNSVKAVAEEKPKAEEVSIVKKIEEISAGNWDEKSIGQLQGIKRNLVRLLTPKISKTDRETIIDRVEEIDLLIESKKRAGIEKDVRELLAKPINTKRKKSVEVYLSDLKNQALRPDLDKFGTLGDDIQTRIAQVEIWLGAIKRASEKDTGAKDIPVADLDKTAEMPIPQEILSPKEAAIRELEKIIRDEQRNMFEWNRQDRIEELMENGFGIERIPKVSRTEIINGQGAKNLLESAGRYTLATGDSLIAGTDKGIDYKNINEDRVAVSPKDNFIAVIDGVGGHGDGNIAADNLANSLLTVTNNPIGAITMTRHKLKEAKEAGYEDAGAVFVAARVMEKEGNKYLEHSAVGDCRTVVIKKDGTIAFRSREHSRIQQYIDQGLITEDQALYNPHRNVITSGVFADESCTPFIDTVSVESGDLVVMMSDGISDNFTPEEIAAEREKYKLTAEELFVWLAELSDKRMEQMGGIMDDQEGRERDGVYVDGFRSKPKRDNRALAILEIK